MILIVLIFKISNVWSENEECCRYVKASHKSEQTFEIPITNTKSTGYGLTLNQELVDKLMCFSYKNLGENECFAIFAQYNPNQRKISFLASRRYLLGHMYFNDPAYAIFKVIDLPIAALFSVCKNHEGTAVGDIFFNEKVHNEAAQAIDNLQSYNRLFNDHCPSLTN